MHPTCCFGKKGNRLIKTLSSTAWLADGSTLFTSPVSPLKVRKKIWALLNMQLEKTILYNVCTFRDALLASPKTIRHTIVVIAFIISLMLVLVCLMNVVSQLSFDAYQYLSLLTESYLSKLNKLPDSIYLYHSTLSLSSKHTSKALVIGLLWEMQRRNRDKSFLFALEVHLLWRGKVWIIAFGENGNF